MLETTNDSSLKISLKCKCFEFEFTNNKLDRNLSSLSEKDNHLSLSCRWNKKAIFNLLKINFCKTFFKGFFSICVYKFAFKLIMHNINPKCMASSLSNTFMWNGYKTMAPWCLWLRWWHSWQQLGNCGFETQVDNNINT